MQIISQYNEEKNLPIICEEKKTVLYGKLLANLRLKNNEFAYQVAEAININISSIKAIECGRARMPFKYYHLYCNHFGVNPITYLKFFELPEKTLKEKTVKLEAYLGLNSHYELEEYLGLKRDTLRREIGKYNKGVKRNMDVENMIVKLLNDLKLKED